jgi:hypothetical protein
LWIVHPQKFRLRIDSSTVVARTHEANFDVMPEPEDVPLVWAANLKSIGTGAIIGRT